MARAIDTHAHVYPVSHIDRIEALGVDPHTTYPARIAGAGSQPGEMAERLRRMDAAGVDVQVLSVMPQGVFGPETDPAAAAEAVRIVNDDYGELIDGYPGRFLAYGALPLPHVEASVAEARSVLAEPGFVGVSIPTVFPDGMTLNDAALDPVWAELDAQRAVVNVHPTGSGARSPMIADHGLAAVNGAPVEEATAVLHLLQADVPRRYPRIRFHIAHLGGDLPFLARRIEDHYENTGAFPSSPGAAMRRMWFDAANFHKPSLVAAVDTFGASQIMAGSDHPHSSWDTFAWAFDYIREARLDQAVIDQILSGNVRGLYARQAESF